MNKYNPDIHHRKSIRLKNYDYTQTGYYFITVCAQNRDCLFGEIRDGKMVLNDAGNMIFNVWNEIPKYYEGIDIDGFQIMPNHLRGIVIVGAAPCLPAGEGGRPENNQEGQARGPAPTKKI